MSGHYFLKIVKGSTIYDNKSFSEQKLSELGLPRHVIGMADTGKSVPGSRVTLPGPSTANLKVLFCLESSLNSCSLYVCIILEVSRWKSSGGSWLEWNFRHDTESNQILSQVGFVKMMIKNIKWYSTSLNKSGQVSPALCATNRNMTAPGKLIHKVSFYFN